MVAAFVSDFESDLLSIFCGPLFAGALPFTWEGDRLAEGEAEGGGVGALAEGADEDDEAGGLFTLGLFSLSFSLLCEGLWF